MVHDSIDLSNTCNIVYNHLILSNCWRLVELYIKFLHTLELFRLDVELIQLSNVSILVINVSQIVQG